MADFEGLLLELCRPWLTLTADQLAQLRQHWELVCLWNKRINLTAIRDTAGAVRRHYGESLFLAAALPEDARRVMDVGSGAGFPGVPLAIGRPGCEVVLLESDIRKSVFLREATGGLANCRVMQRRLEEVRPEVPFDYVVSRAVRPQDVVRWGTKLGREVGLLTTASDATKLRALKGSRGWHIETPIPWQPEHVVLLSSQRST